jgi:acyl carrier protein
MAEPITAIVARHIFQRHGRVVEVSSSDHLFDDLQIDSLDRVEICMAVEEEYHLPREIAENRVFTVADLERAVAKHAKEAACG